MNSIKPISRLRSTAIVLFSLLAGPVLSAHAQQAKPRATAAPQSAPSVSDAPAVSGVLNLNTASAEELTRLPGVGPSRAQAIIELRTRLKGFKSLEDIMKVRGIGRKTFRKLEPMLRLQGPTTLVETRKPNPKANPGAKSAAPAAR